MVDFKTAWDKARSSGAMGMYNEDLFAASMYAKYRQPTWQNKAANDLGWATKAATRPPRQRPAPPSQVWSELSGMSGRGALSRPVDPVASIQARMDEIHESGQIAFNGLELWIHGHKERW
jgi:hypothetical protein